jgi:peptidoglycan/LPS O-acetylase OafA/YrhL
MEEEYNPAKVLENKNKKLEEANIFRGIACLFVVLIHTTGFAVAGLEPFTWQSIIFSIFNTGMKVAVPAFIFVSGLVLSYRYQNQKIPLKKFYWKRIKTVYIPYILYSLLYYALYLIWAGYTFSFEYMFTRILTGDMSYQLYFVILIMQFYFVFPVCLWILKKYQGKKVLLISLILHVLCFIFIPMKYRFFGNYLTFFMLGCYVGLNYKKVMDSLNTAWIKWCSIGIGVVASIYYIVELYLERHAGVQLNPTHSSWQICSLLMIPMYYVLALAISQKKEGFGLRLKKELLNISNVSFSIYLGHALVISFGKRILEGLPVSLNAVLMSVGLIIGCSIYSKIMAYWTQKGRQNEIYNSSV